MQEDLGLMITVVRIAVELVGIAIAGWLLAELLGDGGHDLRSQSDDWPLNSIMLATAVGGASALAARWLRRIG